MVEGGGGQCKAVREMPRPSVRIMLQATEEPPVSKNSITIIGANSTISIVKQIRTVTTQDQSQ